QRWALEAGNWLTPSFAGRTVTVTFFLPHKSLPKRFYWGETDDQTTSYVGALVPACSAPRPARIGAPGMQSSERNGYGDRDLQGPAGPVWNGGFLRPRRPGGQRATPPRRQLRSLRCANRRGESHRDDAASTPLRGTARQ